MSDIFLSLAVTIELHKHCNVQEHLVTDNFPFICFMWVVRLNVGAARDYLGIMALTKHL
jgi:hypothetical protein